MLNQIVNIINEVREEYPIIGNELDGKIYYMNGNDGTAFDWNCNERVCEFMVFHENEMGYIKLMVYNDNEIKVYVYSDGGMHPTKELERHYDKNPLELANFLHRTFDMNNLWDEPVEDYMNVDCDGWIHWALLEDEEDEWEDEEW